MLLRNQKSEDPPTPIGKGAGPKVQNRFFLLLWDLGEA